MSSKSILTIFALITLLNLTNSIMIPHPGAIGRTIPQYKVNLDGNLTETWSQIATDFAEPLEETIDAVIRDLVDIPDLLMDELETFAKKDWDRQDRVAEMQVFSDVTGIPMKKIVFGNLFFTIDSTLAFKYKNDTGVVQQLLSKMCTSVVVRNDQNQILHGRNFDLEFFRYLANITVQVDFYKNGKLEYKAIVLAGIVTAFLNAEKPDAFGVAINARHNATEKDFFMRFLYENQTPAEMLVRDVMESNATNYDQAVDFLMHHQTCNTIYYTVSGVKGNEGCVIEKDKDFAHDYYTLTDDVWYLLKTNYDRDETPPVTDNRRDPGNKHMQAVGQSCTKENLMHDVMSEWPNFNIATVYTVIFEPKTGYMNGTRWWL